MSVCRSLGWRGITYQIEVVLDDVAFERFKWQFAVTKTHDERVVYEFVPHRLDVWSIEQVLDEVASDAMRDSTLVESF